MWAWRRSVGVVLVATALAAWAARARAADVAIPATERSVEVHGFVSPGFVFTTGNNYLAKSKESGSFEFSEVGINFTVPLTDKLRTGLQLFSRDLGPAGNYSPRADWYYLDYRVEDWFGIRAGRVKIPFGLYNDSSDVDAARVPILLPQSIYDIANRDLLLAQTGVEVYGRARTRRLGALEYRMYGGTIFIPVGAQTTIRSPISDLHVPYVLGQRLMWETPLEGLRAGGTLQAFRLEAKVPLPDGGGILDFALPAVLWVGSIEYAAHDLLLAAEYSRWVARTESSDPRYVLRAISERAYAMGSYHVTPWFQPGLYYSIFYPDIHFRSGRERVQHDVAGTLRFDINDHWLFKLEGHFMSGTAALASDLNEGQLPSRMTKNWGVFLVKTTAHF